MSAWLACGSGPVIAEIYAALFTKETTMEKMPVPSNPGEGSPTPANEHGQKSPTDSNAVRQRHQLGEPGKQDGVSIPKAP